MSLLVSWTRASRHRNVDRRLSTSVYFCDVSLWVCLFQVVRALSFLAFSVSFPLGLLVFGGVANASNGVVIVVVAVVVDACMCM